ncbi:MAG: hypothetical protein JSR97_03850, partial [Verrucomicrobia bacterium]|nr:hypothetical protein [Verrucomicrobiota bacterium]
MVALASRAKNQERWDLKHSIVDSREYSYILSTEIDLANQSHETSSSNTSPKVVLEKSSVEWINREQQSKIDENDTTEEEVLSNEAINNDFGDETDTDSDDTSGLKTWTCSLPGRSNVIDVGMAGKVEALTRNNQEIASAQRKTLKKRIIGIEHVSFRSMSDENEFMTTTRTQSFVSSRVNPQLVLSNQSYSGMPKFFASDDSGFDEMMARTLVFEKQKENSKSLSFMTKGSHGIMVGKAGLLVSHLVKPDSWKLSKALTEKFSKELLEKIKRNRLESMDFSLSRWLLRPGKRLEHITFDGQIPALWIQLCENEKMAYANQLESLYQLYILDNGKLAKLTNAKSTHEEYKASSGNKFLIMISSSAGDAVKMVSGFKGGDTRQLYNLIVSKLAQGQEAELIILKMKEKLDPKLLSPELKGRKESSKYVQAVDIKNNPFIKNAHIVEQGYRWTPAFFTDEASGFVEMMISEMQYERQKETVKSLRFMTEKSPGIIATSAGVLVSHSVKFDRWKLSETLTQTKSEELLKKLRCKQFSNLCSSLSTRISDRIDQRFDYLSFDGNIPIIWMQLLRDGTFAHINQLPDFYKLCILDNGRFIEFSKDHSKLEIHKLSVGNKFVILISSFASDLVSAANGFDEADTGKLYRLIWNKAREKYGQGKKIELIIMRMKNNLKDRSEYTEKEKGLNSNMENKDCTRKDGSLEHLPFRPMKDESRVKLQSSVMNIAVPSNLSKKPSIWSPTFFANHSSGFVEIMTSNMGHEKLQENSKRLNFMTKGSPGIMVTSVGILSSYLVKLDSWELPETLASAF